MADAPGRHEPGTGEINYGAIYRKLEELGYRGCVGYGLFPTPDTRTAAATIMKD